MKRGEKMTEVKEKIKVKVFRFDPSIDKEPRYVTYEVPFSKEEKMCVLSLLDYIYENLDSSLAYLSSCRVGRCHCCDLMVNGKAVEACSELVLGDITIEPPLKLGFKVIKDLIASDILLSSRDVIALTRNKIRFIEDLSKKIDALTR